MNGMQLPCPYGKMSKIKGDIYVSGKISNWSFIYSRVRHGGDGAARSRLVTFVPFQSTQPIGTYNVDRDEKYSWLR